MVHRKFFSLSCKSTSKYTTFIQSTLKGQYTSRNESMGSEKKSVTLLSSPLLPSSTPLGPSTLSLASTSFSLLHDPAPIPIWYRLFYGHWPPPKHSPNQGSTALLVEQVSHHPPITAYLIENKSKGLRLVGHNAQKTSFSGNVSLPFIFLHLLIPLLGGSIIVKQIGHAILTVSLAGGKKEEYLITLPRLRIDGLWSALLCFQP